LLKLYGTEKEKKESSKSLWDLSKVGNNKRKENFPVRRDILAISGLNAA
jgi:hypothetical protein